MKKDGYSSVMLILLKKKISQCSSFNSNNTYREQALLVKISIAACFNKMNPNPQRPLQSRALVKCDEVPL